MQLSYSVTYIYNYAAQLQRDINIDMQLSYNVTYI